MSEQHMHVLCGIDQLATCPPHGGQADIGAVTNAAIVINDGVIEWCGAEQDLPTQYAAIGSTNLHDELGLAHILVTPGLIDCHTHLCFGGWRGDEFEMRIQGQSYQAIAAAGGGIRSTVAATRTASIDELSARARQALDGMLQLGVTTVECKSGYGLDLDNELKQLQVYRQLNQDHVIDLIPTFLGAHIIPPEYSDNRTAYVDLVCDSMLPRVAAEQLASFCDVYVDTGAFTVDEGRRILGTARALGLGLKAHAEQLSQTGAAAMAAELGAASVEHLEYLSDDTIPLLRQHGTVAVSLPLASLYLRERYLDARALIGQGVNVAVATDFNPGSAPSWHIHFALTLACLNQQMTPAEALKGATAYAALAVGRQQQLGSLLPGYQADLAIIDAPSVNHWLYHLRPNACQGVIKHGQWVYRSQ